MTISLAISVAHCAARPERVETLKSMEQVIRADPYGGAICIEAAPGKPHEWSFRQWKGAVNRSRSHCVLLNDDLILCKDFLAIVRKVIEARPNHLINLYNSHDLAHVAVERKLSWLTSVNGLIGNAYVLPTEHLRAFLEWRAHNLTPGTIELLSEDNLLNLWAMEQGALVWHTVPALVDHDTSVPSCFDNTQVRKPTVGPLPDMSAVDWNTDAIHVGRAFRGTHQYLLTKLESAHGPGRRALIERYYAIAGDRA